MKLNIPSQPKIVGIPITKVFAGHWFMNVKNGSIGFCSKYDDCYTWLTFENGQEFNGYHIDIENADKVELRVIDLGPVELEK